MDWIGQEPKYEGHMETTVPAKKTSGDIQSPPGQDPVEPALGELAAGILNWMVFRGLSLILWFCDFYSMLGNCKYSICCGRGKFRLVIMIVINQLGGKGHMEPWSLKVKHRLCWLIWYLPQIALLQSPKMVGLFYLGFCLVAEPQWKLSEKFGISRTTGEWIDKDVR